MGIEVVDGTLFASLEPVALRGSACGDCGAHVFPSMGSCPMCAGVDVTDVALPTEGTVWSWTTQHFAPKPPFRTDGFAPFSIGYVDLGPGDRRGLAGRPHPVDHRRAGPTRAREGLD